MPGIQRNQRFPQFRLWLNYLKNIDFQVRYDAFLIDPVTVLLHSVSLVVDIIVISKTMRTIIFIRLSIHQIQDNNIILPSYHLNIKLRAGFFIH